MFSIIIETIAGALAEYFAGKAVEKGLRKAGKARGWIALGILLILLAFLLWMGVYLVLSGVWYIGLLMFIIAAMIVYVTVMAAVRRRK